MEQQRLDLQKTHSTELEKMLEKASCHSFTQRKKIIWSSVMLILQGACALYNTNVHTILSDKFQTEGHWERIQREGTESHRDNRGTPGQYQPS